MVAIIDLQILLKMRPYEGALALVQGHLMPFLTQHSTEAHRGLVVPVESGKGFRLWFLPHIERKGLCKASPG